MTILHHVTPAIAAYQGNTEMQHYETTHTWQTNTNITYHDYYTPYYTNYGYGPSQTQPFFALRHQVVYYCGINDLHFGAEVEARPWDPTTQRKHGGNGGKIPGRWPEIMKNLWKWWEIIGIGWKNQREIGLIWGNICRKALFFFKKLGTFLQHVLETNPMIILLSRNQTWPGNGKWIIEIGDFLPRNLHSVRGISS